MMMRKWTLRGKGANCGVLGHDPDNASANPAIEHQMERSLSCRQSELDGDVLS